MKEVKVKYSIYVPYWYTSKFKDMLLISSRESRQNQRLYFERVDKGEQIIVQRGKDKAYTLTPVTEDDVYFNAGMVERIKESIKQTEEGRPTPKKKAEEASARSSKEIIKLGAGRQNPVTGRKDM